MAGSFRVVTDSTADVPPEWRERHRIEVVPLRVLFGEESFRDQVDLSADLTDYEQRRLQDRAKLRSMVSYCQSAQCRTRFILQYFGEIVEEQWACSLCDMCTKPVPTRRVEGETALSA